MGCAASSNSSVDKEERVRVCKERKRLMKQILGFRGELANAIFAYLRALKNTGGTLRQFTESESLDVENTMIPFSLGLPPTLPSPPPPQPPPPLPLSPDFEDNPNAKETKEIIETGEGSWADISMVDEEYWAETRSHFEDDQEENIIISDEVPSSHPNMYDDSSMMSGQTKDPPVDMAMVVWRTNKTLSVIVKELDDYFLKASGAGKDIAVLVDMGTRYTPQHHHSRESKGKANNTGTVLGSLSWSSSSRSLHLTRDAEKAGSPMEPCKPGAHCITLEKLYAEEQLLYKALREEALTKLEHQRKFLSLQKHQNENADVNKIEKTRSTVENLQSDIVRLQELVKKTCSSILLLIDNELHPQLVALLSGLMHMWKTMYDCHRVQIHISQQVNNLSSQRNTEATTESHREATVQLENEVKFWYNSFCRLTKCQREYISSLCRWIQLSDCVVDRESPTHYASRVRNLCEKWQLALDRLPEKVVSEAIKGFLLVIRSIILQQEQECNLKKKSDKLERRLHTELNSLVEMEKKLEETVTSGNKELVLSPKHPLSVKRAKTAALMKLYQNEKDKYLACIQATSAMSLNNLHACLPHVFEALMEYSSACTQAFEMALSHAGQDSDVEQSRVEC